MGELQREWTRHCVMQLMGWCNSLGVYPVPRFYSLGKRFTELRKGDERLQEHSFAITRYTLKRVEEAYKRFYKKQGSLPRFHAKWHDAPLFSLVDNTFKLRGEWLHIAKIGEVKLTRSNPYADSKPVSGTIKYEGENWYAYLMYGVEAAEADSERVAVGLDRNVKQITLSDGTRYDLAGCGQA